MEYSCYLYTVAVLILFFIGIILYLKYGYQAASTFKNIDEPDYILFENGPPVKEPLPVIKEEPPVYKRDSRYVYSTLPPVNVNVDSSVVQTSIPVEYDLYTTQGCIAQTLLDQPADDHTNQLVYSGGDTQMITIPLQDNYPYNEALRTQKVLVTPYNKVKYGTC
jgi:hypothetical protein